ncbi:MULTISPECIES: diguanylate cyclase [Halomonadaceae]|uniref:diguanylate cyclase n=1 Tax=Halomonadaceae TaxID=28256 RepID=UPI001C62A29F|nr:MULTISPECIES: diguanylate cyclase [Halomonas]MCG7590122.1 diguanylate cyclase [Halomonas sp. McD50-5]MCG7615828.1 diguanylate cyclase [Halomonas sp. McD50-4]
MLNKRWQHIRHYKLSADVDTDALDKLIASVADFFEFPIALVSVLGQKQWFIAKSGLDVDVTSLEDAFCRHVVALRAPLVIEDASQHPDFCDNPLVLAAPHIRFYAGVPLTAGGREVGAVCLIDNRPNTLSEKDLRFLESLSYFISDYIYLIDKQRSGISNSDFAMMIESADVGVWDWEIANDHSVFNQRWCEMLGLECDEVESRSSFWKRLIHSEDFTSVNNAIRRLLAQEDGVLNVEYRMCHAEGHWLWVNSYGRVVANDSAGRPLRLTCITRDISEKKSAELRERKQVQLLNFMNRAQSVFLREKDIRHSCELIFDELLYLAESQFGLIGQVQVRSDGEKSLFIHALSNISWSEETNEQYRAYQRGELFFNNLDNLFGHVVTSGHVVIANRPRQHHASRGTPAGHPPLQRFLGLPIKIADDTVGMIGLANKQDDYTDEDALFFQPLLDTLGALFYALEVEKSRHHAEQQLRYLAETDMLTTLPNRRAFVERAMAFYLQARFTFTVAVIDIDYFKSINDQYGHHVGDEVLKEVANRLSNSLRTDDLVARMGGEEFGVCLCDTHDAPTLETLRRGIAEKPVLTSEGAVHVTVSIGACQVSPCGSDEHWEEDLRHADMALYRAKKEGRNRVRWHMPSISTHFT